MKLSQMTNDQAREVIIRLAVPASNLMNDKNILPILNELREGKEKPVAELIGGLLPKIVALTLKDHADDLYEIVGAMAQKPVEEVGSMNLMQTIGFLRDSVDKDFLDFFKSSGSVTNKPGKH